jgi:hypothetical protein
MLFWFQKFLETRQFVALEQFKRQAAMAAMVTFLHLLGFPPKTMHVDDVMASVQAAARAQKKLKHELEVSESIISAQEQTKEAMKKVIDLQELKIAALQQNIELLVKLRPESR